jgi:hypothetical protein
MRHRLQPLTSSSYRPSIYERALALAQEWQGARRIHTEARNDPPR